MLLFFTSLGNESCAHQAVLQQQDGDPDPPARVRAICSKIAAGCFADTSFTSTVTWLHFEILGPEIDRRLVGTQEILGHLLERRRTESAHVKMHAIDSADR
jgi:hypothetical protein